MSQNIGEGYFIDDTDEDEDSDDSSSKPNQKKNDDGSDDMDRAMEDYDDHDKFLEQMMGGDIDRDFRGALSYRTQRFKDIEREIKEEEEKAEREEDMKMAEFGDNNYWRPEKKEEYDVDALLAELE